MKRRGFLNNHVPYVAGIGSFVHTPQTYDEKQGRVARQHLSVRPIIRFDWNSLKPHFKIVLREKQHTLFLVTDPRNLSVDDFKSRKNPVIHTTFPELLNVIQQTITCQIETMAISKIAFHAFPDHISPQVLEDRIKSQMRVFADALLYRTLTSDLEELNSSNSIKFELRIACTNESALSLPEHVRVTKKLSGIQRAKIDKKIIIESLESPAVPMSFPPNTILTPVPAKLNYDSTMLPASIPTMPVLMSAFKHKNQLAPMSDLELVRLKPGQELSIDVWCTRGQGGGASVDSHSKFIPAITHLRDSIAIDTTTITDAETRQQIQKQCPQRVFDIEDLQLVAKRPWKCTECGICSDPSKWKQVCVVENETSGEQIVSTERHAPAALKKFQRKMHIQIETLIPGTKNSFAMTPELLLERAFDYLNKYQANI